MTFSAEWGPVAISDTGKIVSSELTSNRCLMYGNEPKRGLCSAEVALSRARVVDQWKQAARALVIRQYFVGGIAGT